MAEELLIVPTKPIIPFRGDRGFSYDYLLKGTDTSYVVFYNFEFSPYDDWGMQEGYVLIPVDNLFPKIYFSYDENPTEGDDLIVFRNYINNKPWGSNYGDSQALIDNKELVVWEGPLGSIPRYYNITDTMTEEIFSSWGGVDINLDYAWVGQIESFSPYLNTVNGTVVNINDEEDIVNYRIPALGYYIKEDSSSISGTYSGVGPYSGKKITLGETKKAGKTFVSDVSTFKWDYYYSREM